MEIRFKLCAAEGCDRNSHRDAEGRLGYCSLHYQRLKKYGDYRVVNATPSPAKDWIQANKNHDGDECLIWPFHRSPGDGYGRIHRNGNGPITTASRFMLETTQGPPPSNKHEAAHSCGQGHQGCVNPKHLYWATPAENQDDRVTHGTSNRGTQQWKAKLTEDDVRQIRAAIGTESQLAIAARYGVDPSVISDIKRGKKWAWLD